ncbi:hypothetical protein GYH30_027344 [Glycine max]|nr:hypothetical protein GYH30_027344 [Glycine max]
MFRPINISNKFRLLSGNHEVHQSYTVSEAKKLT